MIVRTEKKGAYTSINNTLAQDKSISYEALGLWLYLITQPPDWVVNIKDLQNRVSSSGSATTGRDKVRKILRQLEAAGLAELMISRDEKTGQASGKEWVIFDEKQPKDRNPESQSFGEKNVDSRELTRKPENQGFGNRKPRNQGFGLDDKKTDIYLQKTAIPANGTESLKTPKVGKPGGIQKKDIIQKKELVQNSLSESESETGPDPEKIIVQKIIKLSRQKKESWEKNYRVNGELKYLAECFAPWWIGKHCTDLSDTAILEKVKRTGSRMFQGAFESSMLKTDWHKREKEKIAKKTVRKNSISEAFEK